jgi:hypothetical protein
MSLVHHLYIGHFIPEQGYVRFQGHEPAVTRPVDRTTVTALLKHYLGESATPGELPDLWAMSILSDYIVCDLLGSPAEALRFAADYAEQTGAVLFNQGSFSLLTPAQLRQEATIRTTSAPRVEAAARSGA